MHLHWKKISFNEQMKEYTYVPLVGLACTALGLLSVCCGEKGSHTGLKLANLQAQTAHTQQLLLLFQHDNSQIA